MNQIFDLQMDFISETNHGSYRTNSIWFLFKFARELVNPWRIVRDDGVVIACSYGGFTSMEQAQANGRVEA